MLKYIKEIVVEIAVGTLIILMMECFKIACTSEIQENSNTYLKNVVAELQLLNEVDVNTSVSPNPVLVNRRSPPIISKHQLDLNKPENQEPLHFINNPSILGFSSKQLAALYTKALQQGARVRQTALTNTMSHRLPEIVGTQVQFTDPNQYDAEDFAYRYYFYPLKTFSHELVKDQDYKTMPYFHYDLASTESKKQENNAMSPFLAGIGSFLGMAIFFVLTILLYPRLIHYINFPLVTAAKAAQEHQLTPSIALITEAIEFYNNN